MKLNLKSAITVNEQVSESKYNQPLKCQSESCNLNGTMSAGTNGESKFYCRFHFGKDFKKNPLISNTLSLNPDLFYLLDICSNPDLIVHTNKDVAIFHTVNATLLDSLTDMGLEKLYFKDNLLKTRSAIMRHIDEKVTKI